MFITIVLVLIGLAAVAALIFPIYFEGNPTRALGYVLGVAFVIMLALTTITSVQAKNVGVLTTFGKPADRTLSPGIAIKAPWQKVTEVDGTIQTDEYRGDDCINVRIGDGSRSCLTATIRWRIVPEAANTIFGDYRSDDPTQNLRRAVVSTQFKSAAQAVLSNYNPIASLETVDGSNAQTAANLSFAPDYDAIAKQLTEQMEKRTGKKLIEVQSISVSYVSLSDSTQKKLDDFIAAVGDTRIAAQKKSTATEEAAANKILSDSVSNDPNVLVSKCLDTFDQMVETKQQVPAAFSCALTGGAGGAVVVPRG